MRFGYLVAALVASASAMTEASDFVQQLFELHNKERQKNGVAPFTCLDSQLSSLSADHVKYEVSIDNINHDGFSERCQKVGNVACGENTLYDFVGDPTKFTESWMNSPGHRKNILNGEYKHVGFAVQRGSSGKWFATAFFTNTNPKAGTCGGGNNNNTPTRGPAPSPAPWTAPTQAPWSAPTQPPSSPTAASDFAQQLFDLHNQERRKNGLPAYDCLDTQLSQLSMDHVKYEISIDNINHNGFSERCQQIGNVVCSENTLYDFVGDAAKFTESWMNSPGHRKNILGRDYKHAGFAVQKGPSGKWFATAMFTDSNPRSDVCANKKGQQAATPAPWSQAPSRPTQAPWTRPTRGPSTPVPTTRATPTPTQSTTPAGADEVVKQLFRFHNEERIKNGLPAFACLNSKLNALSMDHVNYEIRAGKISHDNFSHRCAAAGNNGACGENTLYNYDGDARGMTTQWMNSPGHRKNILNREYNTVGFAVKKASDGRFYATTIFTHDERRCQ
ncbi:hypothetical protein, variant [Saprolegnia diclina VS20]|uniref:SCP domain-containing protein n=1 Tax=Saprolegnia diclina (strain VS20) TaxID=1156394 RepID=T0PZ67_SAPDV|nr:hypothetical protein, variant [Saprolegnia diclina VS20]EQC30864.1 hypothetical protein, variant [Saprolegnia diclina VS20]|eukprot:XP_008615602.1 hypothetical protein, variant [Saprolegnia diclina VS20]